MDKYFLTPIAQVDREAIWHYIAQDNPIAADQVRNDMKKSFEILADHPHIGHKREDLTHKQVRFWGVYNYLVVYKPDTKPLEIVRILSSYRDIANIL